MAEPPSSPPNSDNLEDTLSWYKSQYEQLESELVEFRDSSKELEQELEKDIERAEKQERILRDKAETLGFEVQEWKVGPIFICDQQGYMNKTDETSSRENTKSPRQRPVPRKMRSRRKSRHSETRTELCS